MTKRPRVLLIQPPFSHSEPSCALGRLKASLYASGVSCDCCYLNLDLAAFIDDDLRDWIDRHADRRLFSELLYGAELFPDYVTQKRFMRTMRWAYERDRAEVEKVERLLQAVKQFNGLVIARWRKRFPYDVLGISANYNLVPSLYWAAMLKRLHPRVQVVLGGAECIGDVGRAIARTFPFVDWVVDGEGEEVLPWIVRIIGKRSEEVPPGTSRRMRDGICCNESARELIDLRNLPMPDYDDYFCSPSFKSLRLHTLIPVEGGRGCWWGKCAFCGEPCRGAHLYRRMPDQHIVQTMEYLAERHKHLDFRFVDSVQPTKLESFALALIGSSYDFRLNMALRPDIRESQLELLARAGLTRCIFGIESFSERMLRKMNKGVSMLRSIVALKAAHRLGIRVNFNIISPYPGETLKDQQRNETVLNNVSHLINDYVYQPPFGLQFGSIIYKRAIQHGIRKIWSSSNYELYLPPEYRFTPTINWDYAPKRPTRDLVSRHMASDRGGALEMFIGGRGFCLIRDRRMMREREDEYVLTPPQSSILIACMYPKRRTELHCTDALLKRLVRLGLLLESDGAYLTLATRERSADAVLR